MPFVTRKSLFALCTLAVVAVGAVGGFVWSGVYNIAADDAHTRPVYAVLETLRERSIAARSSGIAVPDLDDDALVRQGAGNYAAMCAGCHLAPGQGPTEMSRGLYPAPTALATRPAADPAHDFWVIKHGIKASGMPAWGKSMEDEYIWGMVALIRRLPSMDASTYAALVASSGGHQHGGGESGAADHHGADGGDAHGHAPAAGNEEAPSNAPGTMTHRHADGTVESHPVPTEAPKAVAPEPAAEPEADQPAEDHSHDHDHEH